MTAPGEKQVAFSVADSLLLLSLLDDGARVHRLRGGLADPRGVAFQRFDPDLLCVCERGADRLLEVRITTHEARALAVSSGLIAGGSLMGILIAVLVALGVFG